MIEKCLRLAECNENLLLVLLLVSTSTRQGLRGRKLPAALRWRAHWARREFNNVLKCTCWSKSPPLNKNDTVLSFPFQDGSIWSVQTTKLYETSQDLSLRIIFDLTQNIQEYSRHAECAAISSGIRQTYRARPRSRGRFALCPRTPKTLACLNLLFTCTGFLQHL